MLSPFRCPRSCRWAEQHDSCRFNAVLGSLTDVTVNSHIVKIATVIKSLDALKAAAAALGLEFRQGQQTYRWYGRSVGDYPLPDGIDSKQLGRCDHAIGIPGDHKAYEVGVVKMPNGTYSLLWDFWNGGYGLESAIGKDGGMLTSEYNLQAAIEAANSLGWQYSHNGDHVVIYHPSSGVLTVTAGGVDASGFAGIGCHDAIMQLNIPVTEVTAKPEFTAVAAQVSVAASH